MEYCDGGDLNDYSKNHYTKLLENKFNLMTQISRGLSFLHDQNIVHRNLKPANILIQHPAEPVKVKLSDFGLAKFHQTDEITSALEIGKDLYMAPEFSANPGGQMKYGKSADMFALGMTFQAIIKAREGMTLKPYDEEFYGTDKDSQIMHIGQTILKRYKGGGPSYTVVADSTEDDSDTLAIKELIRKMTSVNPSDRPTAYKIQESLENLLNKIQAETETTILDECIDTNDHQQDDGSYGGALTDPDAKVRISHKLGLSLQVIFV